MLGLAPAAHGGNRTGRVFTGDRSGDWLFASMHRTGFANQPHSVHAGDGLELRGAFVAAAVRCAPPANKPLPAERDNCLPYAAEELRLIRPAVIVCLGKFAWDAACRLLAVRPRPAFGHLAEFELPDGPVLARLLPPEPAEHLHRQAHGTHAGRGLQPCASADRGGCYGAPRKEPIAEFPPVSRPGNGGPIGSTGRIASPFA